MRVDWWTLGLQTVNLLVLLWLLGRYLFRPMAAIIAQRQAEAAKLIDGAKAAQAKADEAARNAKAALAASEADRAAAIDASHAEAEAQRAALIETARKEAEQRLEDAKIQIARMQDQADARIGARATALAGDIAARLLEATVASLPITTFLDGFAKALGDLPQSAREGIGANGDNPTLISARPLTDADLAACRAVLGQVLACEVPPMTGVDPALIAGLRFTSTNVEVNANLRDDLDRVLAGLEHYDS